MQLFTENRLILDMSFIGENFDEDMMVLYSPFGMIHKIHMALAGPDRLIVVLAIQDHSTVDNVSGYYFSRIFACSYVKNGSSWKFDDTWANDVPYYPGFLRVNKTTHLNENCTHPQIVVDKIANDSQRFHIFYMVDDMPGGALEGTTNGEQNPQYGYYTDNYFVVYSDYVNFTGPTDTKPTITTTSLPNGKEGVEYNQTLNADGTQPITWSLEGGELPAGFSLEGNQIKGTTTDKNMLFNFTVKATNAFGEDTKDLSIFIDSVVINSILPFEKSPILVYPNPASDIIFVVNENQQNMQILLFDFLGREVLNLNASGQAQIDMSKMTAGIYNMRIQYGNTVENKKIVKK
jgi:hypothetical protein